ncbi:MAG: carbohydrate ABC transporter permease [Nitriliruptoraceae bacterium]|nr:carbohydrate ABC transporter permease [Nitriliruptoraceae bacterium]
MSSTLVAQAKRVSGWRLAGSGLALLLILIYGFPLFWMITTAFKSQVETVRVNWLPSEWVTDAYTNFFASEFLPALLNSLRIAGVTITLSMVLGIMAAHGLSASDSKLITPLLMFIILVQLIPPSITFIPLFRVLAQLNVLGSHVGVSLAQTSLFLPFAILLIRPALQSLPRDLREASAVDGAGEWRYLLQIAIPLLRNTLVVIAAILFVASWGDVVFPQTLLFSNADAPLSSYIARSVDRFSTSQNALMAVSTLVAMPTLLIVLIAQRQLKDGLTLGSVK